MTFTTDTRLIVLTSFITACSLAPRVDANLLDTEPQTRNSPVIETPEAVKLEPFTGSAVYTYKFEVPPGTGGLTPDVQLSYSTLTRGTEYGFGWTLNMSRIERSTRFGAPTYWDEQDDFELDGELLVPDPRSGSNRFHKQHADFSRIQYLPGSSPELSYWEVTRTDGTKMRYGSRAAAHSRLTIRPSLTGKVFRWSLDEVIDARGNSYIVDYECEPGGGPGGTCSGDISYVYPKRIKYSFRPGGGATPPAANRRLIVFNWDDRGYPLTSSAHEDIDRPTSYRSGYKVQIGRRLIGVAVGIDSSSGDGEIQSGEQIRRYVLTYAPKTTAASPNEAPFSKLVSIQRYGSNDVKFPSETNPRATQFEYSV
ncbi:MAG TPA: SpvB/TcaC N-terminal domain-containing protein, partial [Myxococcota bacterium]|nr:SpvB/TcaC N-terminal domain-containing protein [Myxococcota bacterium]